MPPEHPGFIPLFLLNWTMRAGSVEEVHRRKRLAIWLIGIERWQYVVRWNWGDPAVWRTGDGRKA